MHAPRIRILAAAALALGLSAPVRAVDNLTGSYTGKMSCKGYVGGAPDKAKLDLTVTVVETKGTRLRFAAGGVAFGGTVPVYQLEDGTKTDRAKIQGLDCGSSVGSLDQLALEADVVIKPGGEKGTIKGTLTRRHGDAIPGSIAVCTFTVKRTSTELPEVPTCLIEM